MARSNVRREVGLMLVRLGLPMIRHRGEDRGIPQWNPRTRYSRVARDHRRPLVYVKYREPWERGFSSHLAGHRDERWPSSSFVHWRKKVLL